MAEILRFPSEGGGQSGGSGPEDPMLEARVARLEDDMKDVKASLKSIELSLAEIKGRMSSIPTSFQLMTMVITTWSAGAAIVFTLLRFAPK